MSEELRLPLYNPAILEDFLEKQEKQDEKEDARGVLVLDISPTQDNEYEI